MHHSKSPFYSKQRNHGDQTNRIAQYGRARQLLRVFDLIKKPYVMFRESVCARPVAQQGEVAERWPAVHVIALGDIGHRFERATADILGIHPQRTVSASGYAFRRV